MHIISVAVVRDAVLVSVAATIAGQISHAADLPDRRVLQVHKAHRVNKALASTIFSEAILPMQHLFLPIQPVRPVTPGLSEDICMFGEALHKALLGVLWDHGRT